MAPEWLQIGNDIDGASVRDSAGQSVSLSKDGNVLAIGSPFTMSMAMALMKIVAIREFINILLDLGLN